MYPFSNAGLQAAVSACVADDIVRIIDSGTITITTVIGTVTRCTIEGDPSLYTGNDPTTLPRLDGSGSVRGIDLKSANCTVNNLWLSNFPINSGGFAGGAINSRYNAFTADNLYFTDCVMAIQACGGGTHTRIRGKDCASLYYGGDAMQVSKFWFRQLSGYNHAVDLLDIGTTASFKLGAIYMPGLNGNDRAFNTGTGCVQQDCSVYRAGGTGSPSLARGTSSYVTRYGFPTLGGTDGGNNELRDPLFTDGANADFTWQAGSLDFGSGVAVGGVTTDIDGDPLPTGAGWPRGPYGYESSTSVSSVTVVSSTSVKLNLAALVSNDATWTDAGNYTITASGGAVAVTVASAAVTDAGMSITLTTSEHTNGGAYNVEWAGLTNVADGDDDYTGTSTPPVVSSAAMTAAKVIRVTFSKSMTNNAALTTVGNYLISGMVVSGVVRVDATRVDVTMTERIPAADSTITVNGPQDTALNPVSNSAANFAVPYLTFVPGGTATNEGRSIAVAFNLPPTGGVSSPSDWTVTKTGLKGADVKVTGVVMASANAALTVHPGMTRGVAYTVTAPLAENAAGGLG